MRDSGRPQAMPDAHHIRIVNLTRKTVLGSRIRVPENSLARAIGLLGEKRLDPGGGLFIDPSSGIHTFGMRFAIDVIALDRKLRVRGLWQKLGPFRIAGLSWRTSCVVELPVGAIEASGTRLNDQLVVEKPG
jgi:uncharacterized membrane protein (UPF0127 family)